ncbi:MAG: type II secretion system F family protein, partial [Campylobacterota bacterium]|nr:type II secretion system F family protein [Campylobacterota bacterium]
MKYFEVIVLEKGKKNKFTLYAESKKEASYIAKIKLNGLILKIVESTPPLEDRLKKFKDNFLNNIQKKKLKQDALIAAIRQLAVMANAGISIHDSLKEIADATNDKNLHLILSTLAEDINSGLSMSQSMENFRYELGNLTLAMVELGEKTGNMAESLHKLADMLEEIRRNIIKFKKAMAYPRNVMIAMGIAFTVLISYVVPQFKAIFEGFGAELPMPTKILLFLEHLFNTYGIFVLAGIIIGFMLFRYIIDHNIQIRFRWHQFLLKTYLIGNIILFATLSRFVLVFSELVRAGIPIAEALETAIAMIDNLPLKQKLIGVRSTVEKGGTLNDGLADTGLFENMIIQMVTAGEASGQLDAMLDKVNDYYKMRFDAIIDGLSEAIEPIMLLIIAALVILLALGIFLPMW